ncbi:hypothetical protein EBQ90_06160 [bacterium]|nr:hypothetical protein [bacterium]
MGKDNAFSQNPELAKLLRECDRGDDLFLEGSVGNTVFLILQGSVELKKKVGNHQITIGKVEAGAFIGEQALLQDKPFPRFASARAASRTLLLELGPHQFSQLEKTAPEIYTNLLKKAFKNLVARNERSEQMMQILREYDGRKRFLSFVHFLAAQALSDPKTGKTVRLDPAGIAFELNCDEEDVLDWIQTLVDSEAIAEKGENEYTVTDENAILNVGEDLLAPPRAA